MSFFSLVIQFQENIYKIEPYFGMLLKMENNKNNSNDKQPEKLISILNLCHNPYYLNQKKLDFIKKKSVFYQKITISYLECLIKICKLNFGLGRWFSKLGQPIFEDAGEAIRFFRNHKSGDIQNDICLPRCLFAASTSKKFKDNGVVFIGVFLPSKAMHPWVIEDGMQPDPHDIMWINFQPVAAIC